MPNSMPTSNGQQRSCNRNKGEYRLIISDHECKNCMDNAVLFQSQQDDLLPDGFWHIFDPNRCSCDGLVLETTLDQSNSVAELFLEMGSFCQEICPKQEEKAPESSIEDVVPIVHQSCSLYDSSTSYTIRRFDPTLQFTAHGIPLNSKFVYHICAMALEKFDKTAFTSRVHVSISSPVDRRRKCVAIKSASEFRL